MTDSTILLAGIFCFGLILLAFVLTILEFRKMKPRKPHSHSMVAGGLEEM